MKYKIPLYKPLIEKEEIEFVNDAISSGWVSSRGKYVKKFENAFKSIIGRKYALSVCNGTAALHLAIESLELKKGTAVLCPTLTYVATANAIRYAGLIPLFVDCNEYGLSNQEQFEQGLIFAAKNDIEVSAAIPVHLYGYQSTNSLKIPIIEDCAESFGTEYENKKSGSTGDISCFSFFGNKTITTGEGGMVTTDKENLYNKMSILRNVGQKPDSPQRYHHIKLGYNYRMTNLCAAIGVAQLRKADKIIKKKRNIAARYKYNFINADIWKYINIPIPDNCNPNYWLVTIKMNSFVMREGLMLFLEKNDIETRPAFLPMHSMVNLGKFYRVKEMQISENFSSTCLNLPSYPEITKKQIDYISDKIIEFYKSFF